MPHSDRKGPSPLEQVARQTGRKLAWKLVAWIGGGTVALIILFVGIFAVAAIYLGGGMPGVSGVPQIGTAQSRPTMWLQDPAIVHSTLPTVVILAVMEHESAGQVFALNYNCTVGPPLPKPCGQVYPGGIIHTKSVDAGLMQVNSGGWPQKPKWQVLGLAQDPFNPQKNIAAGVAELQTDMAKYGYLEYALEAYNSGTGGPNSTDAAYAQTVLAEIQQYEAWPIMDTWTTATPYTGGVGPGSPDYLATAHQTYWLLVAAAGPYGAAYSIPWAPTPPKCVTEGGKTTCKDQPPMVLTGHDLVQASNVQTMNPPPFPSGPLLVPGQTPWEVSPRGSPVWPGQRVWASKVTGPDSFDFMATWPGGHTYTSYIYVGPPVN